MTSKVLLAIYGLIGFIFMVVERASLPTFGDKFFAVILWPKYWSIKIGVDREFRNKKDKTTESE